jgi:hypothetical protein
VGGPNTIPFTAQFDSLEDFGAGVSDIDFTAATVDVTTPAVPGLDQYPWKRLTCFPFSECYPVETFRQIKDQDEMIIASARYLSDGVARSVSGGQRMILETADHLDVGAWFQPVPPATTADHLVVPDGVSSIEAICQVRLSNSTSSWTAQLFIVGRGQDPFCHVQSQTPTERSCQVILPRTPVVPGDQIAVVCTSAVGTYFANAAQNWLQVWGYA